jgi:hypothetical protein
MPNRAEKNAATPDAVLPPAHPESALAPVPAPLRTPVPASLRTPASTPTPEAAPALSANDPNASRRPRDDRAVSDRAASEGIPSGGEEIPSGELGGPTGPEPTRFGDWEKKGRCIDF